MLSAEKNQLLTQVGPGTPMGNLLRQYWMPVAGVSEFDEQPIKPLRLLGEDLVLYRDGSGKFGLVERQCAHRRADLAYGMIEADGIRCNYHGWQFNHEGQCVAQPYEDTAMPDGRGKARIRLQAYPVQEKAGMLWAYMGPQPAPQLPDWEAFSWENGFAQVVISEVPCNWLQCQENSIDPVHFEWMHENWGQRLRGIDGPYGPTHTQLDFEEFDYGFVYKRVKENTTTDDPMWQVGRVCLWPNGFFLGEHFEWRVPIDDENTLSVTWKFSRVPVEREPYVQGRIPTWHGPVFDEKGRWITSHVMNQDFLAWAGQGRIADRTRENLTASDKGIAMIRRRFFEDLERLAAGDRQGLKGLIWDAETNNKVPLPVAYPERVLEGEKTEDILASARKRLLYTTYIFQAGQPDWVKREFSEAMGIEAQEFTGLDALNEKN